MYYPMNSTNDTQSFKQWKDIRGKFQEQVILTGVRKSLLRMEDWISRKDEEETSEKIVGVTEPTYTLFNNNHGGNRKSFCYETLERFK